MFKLRKRPYLFFILPGFLLYSLFVVYPILAAALTSFTVWSGVGPKTFVGLQNYIDLFTEQKLLGQLVNALKNNLILFGLNLLVVTPLQILWAYALYNKTRGHHFLQIMLYAPQFVSTAVLGFIATIMLDANVGLVNQLITAAGFPEAARPWLGMPDFGLFIVWLVGAWSGVGVIMLLFLAAMKMIPREIIEAATIDGQGYFGILWTIVLPIIRPTINNILILIYVWSMTTFDLNFLFGGSSGGIAGQLDTMTLFFYRIAFASQSYMGGGDSYNAMGMGTAVSCTLFLLILVAALVRLSLTKRDLS